MRLFHISEESSIKEFKPRIPTRNDMDKSRGVVWAISEERMQNFLTPRNCPRVTFYKKSDSAEEDIERFLGESQQKSVLAIENKWFRDMQRTKLYIYEFNTKNFQLLDEIAGYYISYETETPMNVVEVDDLYGELFKRNVEVRILDNLWPLADEVVKSTLGFSICRMGFAQERENSYEYK